MPPILRTMRPSQWIKNLVVLAAFFFARWDTEQRGHPLGVEALGHVALAALLFCLVSSAVYLVNDIRDVDADRAHPLKRLRPIAAGALSVSAAWAAAAVLLALGLGGAWGLPAPFRLLQIGRAHV